MSTSHDRPLALLSVTDKTGVVEFARGLAALGFELLSTGGTARALKEAGVAVTEVATHTQSPEILDGRVKTLHPMIHGGILMDRASNKHRDEAARHGIRPIDLVVVNLYQFEAKAAAKSLGLAEAIEFIDIGGPTMLRAAAKNYLNTAAVIDPSDYELVLRELGQGALTEATRTRLAAKTFREISRYDDMIASYFERALAGQTDDTSGELPKNLAVELREIQPLRYGENPHQKAGLYAPAKGQAKGFASVKVLQGKELSYNNLIDLDAATGIVSDFPDAVAVAIIKHTNPCGAAASRNDPVHAVFERALYADPKSAFGGIVAVNRTIDGEAAEAMTQLFLECIAAPAFSPEALEIFGKKKNLRLLITPFLASGASGSDTPDSWSVRSIRGAMLIQSVDQARTARGQWECVTKAKPTADVEDDLAFAMTLVKHVKSNAIVYAKGQATVAVGAGQMSRIDAARFAAEKALAEGRDVRGTVLASDAFFPFRDTVDLAADFGVRAIIQPGGSMRDEESIAACNERGIPMVFTGKRHFRH